MEHSSYLFDFDLLDEFDDREAAKDTIASGTLSSSAPLPKVAEDSEARSGSTIAERGSEDTDDGDSQESLSEVWPGDIVGDLSECSDATESSGEEVERIGCLEVRHDREETPLWEVVFSRVVVRSAPSLEAPPAGICSQKEIVAEDPDRTNPDWVRLVNGQGYILKDGRKRDSTLGVLVQPLHLRHVPAACRREVFAYIKDAWVQARETSNFLKPVTIKNLRKAADDAVSRATSTASPFGMNAFVDSFMADVRSIMSSEKESSAKKTTLYSLGVAVSTVEGTAAAPLAPGLSASRVTDGTQSGWKYSAPQVKGDDGRISLESVMSMMGRMKQRMLPATEDVVAIITEASLLCAEQESLVELRVPCFSTLHIVGDIHGQYWDLMNIIQTFGEPAPNNLYLFNGDFVDRGRFSVEVAIALLAMKVAAPRHVFLNRGNHESIRMNAIYGFMAEVKQKYQEEVFNLFCVVFRCLPLATVVNDSVFVVHGGLGSTANIRLEHIKRLNRKHEPDETAEELMLELLWSDPTESPGIRRSPRGGGVLFGPDVTKRFCTDNGLICVVRSHEMKMDGYEWHHDKACLTVFSAPNYCGICGNLGAVCDITPRTDAPRLLLSDLQVRTFEATNHPQDPMSVGVF